MKKRVVFLLLTLLLLLSFPVTASAGDNNEDSRDAARQAVEPDARDLYQESKDHQIGSSDPNIMQAETSSDGSLVTTTAYEGDWTYYINTGGTATITDYRGSAASVTTPLTLGGIAVTVIGSYTFFDNQNLTSVTVSEGVTQLGDEEYSGGTVLYGDVFEFCYNLTTVNLPASLKKLGFYSFSGCPSLAAVTVAASNTVFKVDGGILFSDSDSDLTYDVLELYPAKKADRTDYSVPEGVVTISPYAIEGNESLSALTFPSSLRSCFNSVMGMPSLTTVTVANGLTNISGFNGCPKLTSVSLPDSVVQYSWRAFAYCEKLTSIVHPTNIEVFDDECFVDTGFTSVTIPASVNYFGVGAFGLCFNLKSINVDAANADYKSVDGVVFSKDGGLLFMYPIGKMATSYAVPEGVEGILDAAFAAAFLDRITLPQSLLIIGYETFIFNNFSTVTIPNNVIEIGYNAFRYNGNLEKFIVYSGNTDYADYYDDEGMFYESSRVVMYGSGNTFSYAMKFGIPFGTITTFMSMSPSNLNMFPYTSIYLTATTTPTGGYVTWSSSNPSIASVDAQGKVKANALGTATITAASLFQTASCVVTVAEPEPIQLRYSKKDVSFYGATNGSISVYASGGNAAEYEYTIDDGINWSPRNTFNGLSPGSYTITARITGYIYNTASCNVTITQPSYMGRFAANKMPSKANAGSTMNIVPSPPPRGYSIQWVTCSSSNPDIATVSSSNITFIAGGKVTIIAKVVSQTADQTKTKTTTIKKTITVKQPVASVSLNLSDTTIARTQKVKLIPIISPIRASDKKVKWTSSNPKVAAVSSAGVVTGKAGGTAVITCTAKDGSGASASCTVNVTPIYTTGIKLSKAALTLRTGKSGSLKATISPKNTDFKTVTWASSNPGVVTVDAKGKLKAIAPGTAVITAATSGGQTVSCAVTVP